MTTIYHNPDCGTSRNVLDILQKAGTNPLVIAYLTVGWTRPQLLDLFKKAELTPRTALRISKSPAAELGLLDPATTDDAILDAMLLHPILVNRPIVSTAKGTRLCRPSETVLNLLENLPSGPLYKEDGTMFLDENGTRVP
jgi:arsenate reductase